MHKIEVRFVQVGDKCERFDIKNSTIPKKKSKKIQNAYKIKVKFASKLHHFLVLAIVLGPHLFPNVVLVHGVGKNFELSDRRMNYFVRVFGSTDGANRSVRRGEDGGRRTEGQKGEKTEGRKGRRKDGEKEESTGERRPGQKGVRREGGEKEEGRRREYL
jgi:hypothetical protein